jgi:deoxyribodipyrimidine photo-lyase
LLADFLTDFPPVERHPARWNGPEGAVDWSRVRESLKVDASVAEVDWLRPGESAAHEVMDAFLENGLEHYDERRNDPTAGGQSNLSPYLHFGQLAAQRVALEVQSRAPEAAGRKSFMEELVVRRELSDNFCHYNPGYDSCQGFPEWARKTLELHRLDARPHLYSAVELERASTHDDLWNAAQQQMVVTGKMHGYLRMYWAKKILEWTPTPEDAMRIAVYLNDRYELDGRDPNGYAGIAWSIGGAHDRPWPERPVFGKVRYMSYNGCRSKFDVRGYVARNL